MTEPQVADLFIASLSLLMVEGVELRHLSVFAEAHKGTRGGPSDQPAVAGEPSRRSSSSAEKPVRPRSKSSPWSWASSRGSLSPSQCDRVADWLSAMR